MALGGLETLYFDYFAGARSRSVSVPASFPVVHVLAVGGRLVVGLPLAACLFGGLGNSGRKFFLAMTNFGIAVALEVASFFGEIVVHDDIVLAVQLSKITLHEVWE